MGKNFLIILITICILATTGCKKTEIVEESQIYDSYSQVEESEIYEIYSHQFLYKAHAIVKSSYDISLILETKEIDDEDINFITSIFKSLELMLKESKELPNYIDKETKKIYDFLNTILYPKFALVRKEFEKKKGRGELDYNWLEEYVKFSRKIGTDVKWTDINLNTKQLKSSNEELSLKEIIQLIAQDADKLKKIVRQ